VTRPWLEDGRVASVRQWLEDGRTERAWQVTSEQQRSQGSNSEAVGVAGRERSSLESISRAVGRSSMSSRQ